MIILILNGLRIETCTTPYLIFNFQFEYVSNKSINIMQKTQYIDNV